MVSFSTVFLALSLFVSGIVADSNDNNLSQTCQIFALIGSGFNTATDFTITAFDPSELAPTAGGSSLVIGALTSNSNPVLSVAPSGVTGTTFNLTDGILSVIDHEADISFTAALLSNGSDVSFTPANGAPLSIPQFCAVADTDPEEGTPFPSLAVNGTLDIWSLCDSTVSEATQIVVFRAADGASEYDFSTCQAVNVLLTGPAFE